MEIQLSRNAVEIFFNHNFNDCTLTFAPTELGKKAVVHSAPSSWNLLQETLRLAEFILFSAFKSKLKTLKHDIITRTCLFFL